MWRRWNSRVLTVTNSRGTLPFYGWLDLVAAIQTARRWSLGPETDLPFPSG
jgi:hypothetical protein